MMKTKMRFLKSAGMLLLFSTLASFRGAQSNELPIYGPESISIYTDVTYYFYPDAAIDEVHWNFQPYSGVQIVNQQITSVTVRFLYPGDYTVQFTQLLPDNQGYRTGMKEVNAY